MWNFTFRCLNQLDVGNHGQAASSPGSTPLGMRFSALLIHTRTPSILHLQNRLQQPSSAVTLLHIAGTQDKVLTLREIMSFKDIQATDTLDSAMDVRADKAKHKLLPSLLKY